MGDVINLNKARKARAKADAGRKAVQNRAKFGRTAADKAAQRLAAEQLAREVDQARRTPPAEPVED